MAKSMPRNRIPHRRFRSTNAPPPGYKGFSENINSATDSGRNLVAQLGF
jgi:hypothetical protein